MVLEVYYLLQFGIKSFNFKNIILEFMIILRFYTK